MPVLSGNHFSSRLPSRFSSRFSSRLPAVVSLRLLLSLLLCAGVFGAGLLYAQNTSDSRTVGKTSAVKKYALVIGNTKYKVKPLKNPRNDAEDMAKLLQSQLGFDVIVGYDLGYQEMTKKVAEFSSRIKNRGPNDIAFFYYSGHGLQYQGENYLVPLDAEDVSEENIDIAMLNVDRILKVLGSGKHGGNIVILDACRNNPYGSKGLKGDDAQGLAVTSRRSNTLIAYATDAGKTASDNPKERNGLYTGELLKNLAKPNQRIVDIFMATRESVLEKSGETQEPWELSSLRSNFVLQPTSLPKPMPAPTPVPTPTPDPIPDSSGMWVTIPGGSFTMGCVDGDGECYDDEKGSNRRLESVSSFQLMKTEVTVDMYQACIDAGDCSDPDSTKKDGLCNWGATGRGDHPINCVDWTQAVQYCNYAGGRLPSAVEFEYGLRGGKKGYIYSWGNSASKVCEYANVADQSAKRKHSYVTTFDCDDGYSETSPAGSFKPNGYGLYDMAGNVWEWTSVQYDDNTKELRGGSWGGDPRALRASHRDRNTPAFRYSRLGFRCAR